MKAKEFIIEMYSAYELNKSSRDELLQLFTPKYPNVYAHHITVSPGVKKNTLPPEQPTTIKVIGYVDDGESIEALVVEVDGSIIRPDGKTYHITWSLDSSKGKKPQHSNDLISKEGFQQLISNIDITAIPNIFK